MDLVIAGVEGFSIPIAGAVKRLGELGHEIVPLAWASAPPASYVTEDAYERMWKLFAADLANLGPFVDLPLTCAYGAMVAENTEDGEGELLRHARASSAPDLPIVASPRLSREFDAGDGEIWRRPWSTIEPTRTSTWR